ncbi:MAG: sulfatase-like hydrolase/transferase [Planctomycetota bacterium]|jgi:arylsulfatase A-like enzyme
MSTANVTRRGFLKSIGLGAAALAMPGCTTTSAKSPFARTNETKRNQPNILILMTDQQRFDSLSSYGCTIVSTPNIDKLAKEGALFENCYSPCPVCTPSRASMLTGKPVPGHGVYKLHDILPDDQVLLPKRLQSLGYETSLVGKLHVSGIWHEAENRHPNDGFDNYKWCIDPGLNFDSRYNAFARWVKKKDPKFYERLKREGKSLHHFPADLHFTRWAAETTIDLIKNRDKKRPFFAMMSLFDPHDPYFDHPVESRDKVRDNKIPKPSPAIENKDMPEGIKREMEKAHIIKTQSKTFEAPIKELRKGYYASIAFLDQEIGKILDFLDAESLTGNTLVIFVSDHGDMLWDRGLFTKGAFFHDPSVRVPFLMRLPGRIPAGSRVKTPVQQLDIAATALSLAGFSAERLKQVMPESMDLLALIQQGKTYENYRDYAVCAYRNTGYGPGHKYFDPPVHCTMFRDERFKLNVYHSIPDVGRLEGELYDMENDPHERDNLWNNAQYAKVKAGLLQRLLDWMVENNVRNFGSRGGEKFFTLKKSYYGGENK